MVKPLGYYTSLDPLKGSPAALCILADKYGDYLQKFTPDERFSLMAIISHCLAINEQPDTENFVFSLEDAWTELNYDISAELGGMLNSLNELSTGDLLGICQTLIENHSHMEVAA